MTLHSPRIFVPYDNVGLGMRETMRLSFYLPLVHRQVATDVVRSLEKFAQAVIPKLDTWYNNLDYPQPLDAAAWEMIKRATMDDTVSFDLTGSKERVAFEYKGATVTDLEGTNSVSCMHCWFPIPYLEERGPAHLRALAIDILGPLPIHSGNLALDLYPLPRAAEVMPTVGEIALRHPGFSIGRANDYHLGTRVHDVTWLTFLGQPVLGEIGGVAALRSRLRSPDTTIEELPGDRVVITLGEWPDAGDVAEGRMLPSYRELARALEPVLHPVTLEPPGIYDSPEQRRQVERRFLD